jgi:hypothetical protein
MCGGRQLWNDIFQSYGLMAMRSEQRGNVFAKLNNGNLSDGVGCGMKSPPSRRAAWRATSFNADASTDSELIGAAASLLSWD